MNPNKASREKGDFTEIAAFMREFGEALVRSIGITPPLLQALYLGCGDGATAIDIASDLVETGNRRAAEAGLSQPKFQGDACKLGAVDGHSF
jgi:hypothetical protein